MGTVDQGFVPESPDRIFARLRATDRYRDWWPGVRSAANGDGVRLSIDGLSRTAVHVDAERPGTGLVLRLEGRTPGTLEWYLEPFKDGTVVSAILELHVREGRRLRVRASLRRALVALRALGESP